MLDIPALLKLARILGYEAGGLTGDRCLWLFSRFDLPPDKSGLIGRIHPGGVDSGSES